MEDRYVVEWLDDERASIHDEVEKEEMTAEDVVDRLNKLTAENRLLEIKANKFERKYIETKLKNDDLKKENKTKTQLIKNLERKVKSQKQRLREMQE